MGKSCQLSGNENYFAMVVNVIDHGKDLTCILLALPGIVPCQSQGKAIISTPIIRPDTRCHLPDNKNFFAMVCNVIDQGFCSCICS